ncbi:MAG: DoxX family protein [Deltaproteobacteria bacterium]
MEAETLSLLPVRATLGTSMIYHGSQKVIGAFEGPGLSGTEQMLESLQIRPVKLWARALAWTELGSGLALLTGIFVRPAAFGILVSQAIAVAKVHAPKGYANLKGGYEYNLALIAGALALLVAGTGEPSFRRFVAPREREAGGLRRLFVRGLEALTAVAAVRPSFGRRLLAAIF